MRSHLTNQRGSYLAEAHIEDLFASLSTAQKQVVCHPWDFSDADRGLLRGFIANHWQATAPCVKSEFFNAKQQRLISKIFDALLDPRWRLRTRWAMWWDTKRHAWGQDQSIAILGTPGEGPSQFLFTGRHITLRAQGPGSSDFAFGGPIVYGHAVRGRFHEKPGHRGNVFWHQAVAADKVRRLLGPETREKAEVDRLPLEHEIEFRPNPQGASVAAFPAAAKAEFERLLLTLLRPYRAEDRDHVMACVAAQGGIDALYLAFARTPRMSAPLWDVWRIEGPAFVWHFQGSPHVHGWIHVASSPSAGAITARRGAFLFPGQDELR